jgi:hypothetical protein
MFLVEPNYVFSTSRVVDGSYIVTFPGIGGLPGLILGKFASSRETKTEMKS